MKTSTVLFTAFLLLVSISSPANGDKCSILNGRPGRGATYRATDMTKQLLKDLIGARISYSGKYVHTDPSDPRKIRGRGIVLSAELWANDKFPSFSIKLMKDSGEKFHVQTSLEDFTFLLKVENPSILPTFLEQAKNDLKQTILSDFHVSDTKFADFCRDPNHQNLRILFVKKTGIKRRPFELYQIESTSAKVPSEYEIAINFLNGKMTEFDFQTPQGPIKLDIADIVAIAF